MILKNASIITWATTICYGNEITDTLIILQSETRNQYLYILQTFASSKHFCGNRTGNPLNYIVNITS